MTFYHFECYWIELSVCSSYLSFLLQTWIAITSDLGISSSSNHWSGIVSVVAAEDVVVVVVVAAASLVVVVVLEAGDEVVEGVVDQRTKPHQR